MSRAVRCTVQQCAAWCEIYRQAPWLLSLPALAEHMGTACRHALFGICLGPFMTLKPES